MYEFLEEEEHYTSQVMLWILNGKISHDALVELARMAYEKEASDDANS